MKRIKLALAALAITALTVSAQDYNRVGLSYNNTHFGATWSNHVSDDNMSLNGIGIDYIHGFSLSESTPLYFETGAKLNFGFKDESVKVGGEKLSAKLNIYTINVPANLAYKFSITDDFSITPYLGLNFKLHLSGTLKATYKNGGTKVEEKANIFSKDEINPTWKRFQMGWHIGVGFQYNPVYFGVSWGTDFLKPVEDYRSSDLSIALGYCF